MLHKVAFIILVIGGLNWLLEAFGFGIGRFLGGSVANIVYIVFGLSAIYEIVTHKSTCKTCSADAAPAAPSAGPGEGAV